MPFDDSEFKKPLDAEIKGSQGPTKKGWFRTVSTEVACVFRSISQKIQEGKGGGGCCK